MKFGFQQRGGVFLTSPKAAHHRVVGSSFTRASAAEWVQARLERTGNYTPATDLSLMGFDVSNTSTRTPIHISAGYAPEHTLSTDAGDRCLRVDVLYAHAPTKARNSGGSSKKLRIFTSIRIELISFYFVERSRFFSRVSPCTVVWGSASQ